MHNVPCHIEFVTDDLDKAADFYTKLFGWKVIDSGVPGYRLVKFADDFPVGGAILERKVEKQRDSWPLLYIRTEDIDKSLQEALALNVEITVEKIVIPNRGMYAVFVDIFGNTLAFWQEL